MDKIIIYADGGARGNPGPAGSGAYITDSEGKMIAEASKFLGHTTNNVAEYEAVLLGFEAAKKKFGKTGLMKKTVELRMDSELVVKQLTGKYQIKEPTLVPYFMKIWNARVKDIPNLIPVHIPREKNKEADRLANDAMDRGA